jgi:CubicO group peptidase (beta-lactamase class C family)
MSLPGSARVVVTLLSLASSLAAQPQGAATATTAPDFSQARRFIQNHLVEGSIPSISVAVARRGEILWEEGFGWADRENRVPATEHTLYYTASIEKSFTLTAVMILNERKQLDLDLPVNEYLGAAKLTSPVWNPAEATVRRVGNHTAGLTTFNPRNHLPADETIRRYGVIFWPPGDHFDYSNLGPRILEEVVTRVSGKSYSGFLQTEVLWPLGMTRASVGIGPGLEKYAAQRYSSGGGLRPPVNGGVYLSAHDLLRFGMFFLKANLRDQKPILSDAAIEAMFASPVSTGDGKYSLSWWIDEDLYGYRSVVAMGGTDCEQARLRLIPSEGIAVAALSNTGSTSSNVVHEILSALLPPYRERRAKAVEHKETRSVEKTPPPEALVGNWRGIIRTHREDIPLTFSIAGSGDVHAKLGSQLATLLNDARFDRMELRGRMSGDLSVEEDTGPDPYHLDFYLNLRNGALNGAAVTGPRAQLPFWVELTRESGPAGGR